MVDYTSSTVVVACDCLLAVGLHTDMHSAVYPAHDCRRGQSSREPHLHHRPLYTREYMPRPVMGYPCATARPLQLRSLRAGGYVMLQLTLTQCICALSTHTCTTLGGSHLIPPPQRRWRRSSQWRLPLSLFFEDSSQSSHRGPRHNSLQPRVQAPHVRRQSCAMRRLRHLPLDDFLAHLRVAHLPGVSAHDAVPSPTSHGCISWLHCRDPKW